MKKCKSKLIRAGLVASAVWMAGVQSQAALIAYDGFNSAATVDAANGVYQDGALFTNTPNNNVIGGTMVGFSTSVWARSTTTMTSPFVATNNSGNTPVSAVTSGQAMSRRFDTAMAGKTVAYMSAHIRMDLSYTNSVSAASAYVCVGTVGLTGGVGAGIGFMWDRTNMVWDLTVRHVVNNAFTFDVVMDSVATSDTGWLAVAMKMDDANNLLSVWVNPTDTSAAATATFSYTNANAVANITSVGVNSTRINSIDSTDTGFFFDEIKLGDTFDDVFPAAIPEPTTVSLLALAAAGAMVFRRMLTK